MPRYNVILTNEERQELELIVKKGGEGSRIKHAQILLKLDRTPENTDWTYDRIKEVYGAVSATVASVAKRFVLEGFEAALSRKNHKNPQCKVTGEIEENICES